MIYDPQRHHRHSIRLRDYRYNTAGGYSVTICTERKQMLFGHVDDGTMRLSKTGEAVEAVWLDLAARYPSIRLDQFALMPNHLHGIIFFSENPLTSTERQPTLGTIIGAFKSLSARAIGQQSGDKSCRMWQRNYYEQIIRSEAMLNATRHYIENNPFHWPDDTENNPISL